MTRVQLEAKAPKWQRTEARPMSPPHVPADDAALSPSPSLQSRQSSEFNSQDLGVPDECEEEQVPFLLTDWQPVVCDQVLGTFMLM